MHFPMVQSSPLQQELLGELIGLARACAGSDEQIPASTYTLLREVLRASAPDHLLSAGEAAALSERICAEKAKAAPNCAHCDHPCGRTAAYDLSQLYSADEPSRSLKSLLLHGIQKMASACCTTVSADAYMMTILEALGNEWYPDDLLAFIRMGRSRCSELAAADAAFIIPPPFSTDDPLALCRLN